METTTTTIDWPALITDQLDWHWTNHLRPWWEGLTDEEYFWEPVPGAEGSVCWNVRPRDTSPAPMSVGSGAFTIDFAMPEPEPAPFTTIAWRMGHLLVGIFGERLAGHFGGAPTGYTEYDYPGTATAALAQIDAGYATWIEGIRGLGDAGLSRQCGPAEGPFAASPMAELVLHINREIIHHGAEICLLRDLYLHRAV